MEDDDRGRRPDLDEWKRQAATRAMLQELHDDHERLIDRLVGAASESSDPTVARAYGALAHSKLVLHALMGEPEVEA